MILAGNVFGGSNWVSPRCDAAGLRHCSHLRTETSEGAWSHEISHLYVPNGSQG